MSSFPAARQGSSRPHPRGLAKPAIRSYALLGERGLLSIGAEQERWLGVQLKEAGKIEQRVQVLRGKTTPESVAAVTRLLPAERSLGILRAYAL